MLYSHGKCYLVKTKDHFVEEKKINQDGDRSLRQSLFPIMDFLLPRYGLYLISYARNPSLPGEITERRLLHVLRRFIVSGTHEYLSRGHLVVEDNKKEINITNHLPH